jgi:hypothetical protein
MEVSEETLLDEIRAAPPKKRDAILSYAYFVLHGEPLFLGGKSATEYVPFADYDELDDFLEFHQREVGVL